MKERSRAESTIVARDLRISYSELVALNIPALQSKGNVTALLGHNGAGKSTLIKSLLGLLEPASGNLCIHDVNGETLIAERDMAFCPENGAVFADVSVERYLELWCRIKHSDGKYYRRRGQYYVERLDLSPLLRKRGRELSKGQRRRVQTALGFMSEPRLFLFDEPFDGLDVQRTTELMEIVSEERNNRSFIISSHRMDVMERVADSVLVLKNGRVTAQGSVAQVCQELSGGEVGSGTLTDAMAVHLRALRRQSVKYGATL
jgi:ABC-2 type transport system ATP-binding protein